MNAALSQKETRQVIASLEKQGARVNKTKNGVRVLFPDGSTTAIHWTTSDYRAAKNMRADIKRAGLTWPFDDQRGKTMNARSEATQGKIREALDRLGELGATASTTNVANAAGVSEVSVLRHLPDMGYESKRKSGGASAFVWSKREVVSTVWPDQQEPKAVSETEPSHSEIEWTSDGSSLVREQERERREKELDALDAAVAALDADEHDGMGISPRTSSMVKELAYPEPSPSFIKAVADAYPPVQPQQPRGREFIDSADSWTIEVPDKLQRLAGRLGLSIEVRVWHEPVS